MLTKALLRSKLLYHRRYNTVISYEGAVSRILMEDVLEEIGKKARKYKGDRAEGYEFEDYISILMWNDEEMVESQRNRTYGEFGPILAKDINWDNVLSIYQMRL